MARANLGIDSEITDEFLKAQESRDVRILQIKIAGEALVLSGSLKMKNNASLDFDNLLVESLSTTDAMFILFNLSDSNVAPCWLLMAWVPDGCKVRDKMLYSSSREDLKRSLGLGYFKAEYAANVKDDVTWDQFQKSISTEFDSDLLTDAERLVLEEKVCFFSRKRSFHC